MTLTVEEYGKIREVLEDVISKLTDKATGLINKGLELGEEDDSIKLMYLSNSLALSEANWIIIEKLHELHELFKQCDEKSQNLQASK